MDYREHPPAPALQGLIKVRWTLAGGGNADTWAAQQAVPDGCVEIITRHAGRSRWGDDQPARFAVGLIERPESFEISGDARFEGLRLWPWAWPLVGDRPLAELRGRWLPFDGPEPGEIEARLAAAPDLAAIGRAILGAATVAEMGRAAGMSPRTLQRWFAARVGLPPRRYLRLLRFQKAFAEVPAQPSLADHAAAQGYADQAHMARDFRAMAGVPARQARRSAKGPFLT
ncbi:MAG TPA: helix-turn-helix domain-containing protein [Allosphingosinicella sp.]|nr:helix-turn-helix domain-containing protein [Allosphingosinicella sp.]